MDGKKKWIANEFFRTFLTKRSITDGDGKKRGGGREGSRVMTEKRKSSSAEGKVRETQADVRRRPRSILSAAVFDFLRGGGGRGGSATITDRKEILGWRQSAATN